MTPGYKLAPIIISISGLPEGVEIRLWANSKTAQYYPEGFWAYVFAGQNVEIAFDNLQVTYDEVKYTLIPVPSILLLLG
jgi:hypothetical protein